jgi:hypothetical protein
LSSKRSYDHNNASEAKKGAMRSNNGKQKPNQFDSARYNSITNLNKPVNLNISQHLLVGQTKERFQATQKVGGKKSGTKVSGNGNGIILPAGAGMQGVPQLKQQLNKNGSVTH